MRLIDADRLNKPIYAEEDNITGSGISYDEICGYNDGVDIAWNKIDQAPTVDAVPVVRCRDCKHAWIHPCGYVYCHRDGRNAYEMTFNLDSFCSYGERKDNG